MAVVAKLRKHLVNVPGWQTNRKIVVIESDDWGSIGIPSKEVYDKLLSAGLPLNESYFAKYDCLESYSDLEPLFSLLSSFKDSQGNHPVITANAIMANPDFDKIKSSGFNEFFYEKFTDSYLRYQGSLKTMDVWRQGIDNHLLWPQFHGREHLNPVEWMRVLNSGNTFEKLAFDNNAFLVLLRQLESKRPMGYLAAFDYETKEELLSFNTVLTEGIALFKEIFGFNSKSFVPPTGIRSDAIDQILFDLGVLYYQVGQQRVPQFEADNKFKNRFWGASNRLGQIFWRRNCTFESSRNWDYNWVDAILYEMDLAFKWNKPCVINSHRVNYIGGIDERNRNNTLKILSELLKKIIKKYPDVEFLSSDQLGDVIKNEPRYFLGMKFKES